MNLYLLSQDANNDYDTYDSVVVAAESEEEALEIRPEEKPPSWGVSDSWVSKEFIKITKIGVATEGTESGVICASFNAG
jgi:hypothetical protein